MKVTSVGSSRQITPYISPPPPQVSSAGSSASGHKKVAVSSGISLPPAPMYTKAEAKSAMRNATDAALRRMAERFITKQYSEGNYFFKLLYGNVALRIDPNLIAQSAEPFVREIEQARRLVEDGGPFSPNTAAQQVLDFVNEQSGGDEAKLERLRAAVQEAFESVGRMAGGKLPELTRKTYEAVMQGLGVDIPAAAAKPAPAAAPVLAKASA